MRASTEITQSGQKISAAIREWLDAEVVSSGDSVHNDYLDDFDKMRKRLTLGDVDENFAAAKNKSHIGRLPNFWQGYESEPENDQMSARLLFAPLMFVSGAHRLSSYLRAQSAEDYARLRVEALGVEPKPIITEQLSLLLPPSGDFTASDISQDELRRNLETAAERTDRKNKRLYALLKGRENFLGNPWPEMIEKLKEVQVDQLHFATSAIALAAKMRGGAICRLCLFGTLKVFQKTPPSITLCGANSHLF